MSRQVLVAVTDLLLQSRVVERARSLGLETTIVGDVEEVAGAVRSGSVALVVLDLDADGLRIQDVAAAARDGVKGRVPVLAFGRHTEPALLRAARDDGCDLVVTRSKLISDFEALVDRLAGRIRGSVAGDRD